MPEIERDQVPEAARRDLADGKAARRTAQPSWRAPAA